MHAPYVFASQSEKDRAMDSALLLREELLARTKGFFAGEEAAPRLEAELLRASARSDRARLEVLLHPDFEEVGSSGRVFDRSSMIAALLGEDAAEIRMEDVSVSRLAQGSVLVRYVSVSAGSRVQRSSFWVFSNRAWRLRYHQGTPAA